MKTSLLTVHDRPTTQAIRKHPEARESWLWLSLSVNQHSFATIFFWLKNLLFLAILFSLCSAFLLWLIHPQTLPLTTVRVTGNNNTPPQQLQATLSHYTIGGFFNVDIEMVRQAVLTLPWIKEVHVQRIWPDTLSVQVQERQAVARWHTLSSDATVATRLLDSEGELFETTSNPQDLPLFVGPAGYQREILAQYYLLNPLLQAVGIKLRELGCNQRQAWYLVLEKGTRLLLGRKESTIRLQRFIEIYKVSSLRQSSHVLLTPALFQRDDVVIDLRYDNGCVIKTGNSQLAL